MCFKGKTHAYLLKISLKHNKKWIPLLNLRINCTSARLALQILSIKDDCNFLFKYFLIIGFCNAFVNSLYEILSFLIRLPQFFYQKICRPFKQVHVDIHSSDF